MKALRFTGGLRRVVKRAQANRAHLRMAGSLLLEANSTERLERFHDNLDSGVAKERAAQFNMKDLIGTIRPQLGKGLSSNFNEQDGSLHSDWRGQCLPPLTTLGTRMLLATPWYHHFLMIFLLLFWPKPTTKFGLKLRS